MKRLHLVVIAALALTATVAEGQQRVASAVQPVAAPVVVLPRDASRVSAMPDAALAALKDAPAGGFASSGFAQFMSSPTGRVLRVVAGVGMIAGGISMDSNGGTVLAAVGAVPLSAGLFDICWLSPIFGGPLKGKDIRAAKS